MIATVISWVLSDAWPYIIAAIGAIGALGGVYLKGRSDVKAKTAVKDLKAEIKAEKDRRDAETDAGAGGAADRLHAEWKRP